MRVSPRFCAVIGAMVVSVALTVAIPLSLTACTAGGKSPVTALAKPAASPQNIVLIGWDGAQRNHVKECLERKELPSIQKLASEGSLVAIDIRRVTDTKAGWAQILTGYEPEVTGVYSNSRYQPIPQGYTVFERLESHFGPANINTAAVIGKGDHVGAEPPQRTRVTEKRAAQITAKKTKGEIVTEDGVKYLVVPGQPYFSAHSTMDMFVNGLGENDVVGKKALEVIDQFKDDRFFLFVHFADADHQGHKYGENSKEYNAALVSCDAWTDKILQKLKDLGLYDKTLVYVTADHGFDEGRTGHSDAPYVFLATNDTGIRRRGQREDITPTILDRFGVDIMAISPRLDGQSLLRDQEAPPW